jgi:hypothetical protein
MRVSCFMNLAAGECLTDFETKVKESLSTNIALRYRVRAMHGQTLSRMPSRDRTVTMLGGAWCCSSRWTTRFRSSESTL